MSKAEKLKEKLLERPSKFKWDDLVKVMKEAGFTVKNAKRGSGRKFYNAKFSFFLNPSPGSPPAGCSPCKHEMSAGSEVKISKNEGGPGPPS